MMLDISYDRPARGSVNLDSNASLEAQSGGVNFPCDDRGSTMRDFAQYFNITPRAVRFYEDKGLLNPSRRGHVRIFVYQDYVRLEKILRAKRIGFSLDDIKLVFDVTDGIVADRESLLERRDMFEAVLESLARRREDIDIIARDMAEINRIITETLEKTPASQTLFDLATQYEAVFLKTELPPTGNSSITPKSSLVRI